MIVLSDTADEILNSGSPRGYAGLFDWISGAASDVGSALKDVVKSTGGVAATAVNIAKTVYSPATTVLAKAVNLIPANTVVGKVGRDITNIPSAVASLLPSNTILGKAASGIATIETSPSSALALTAPATMVTAIADKNTIASKIAGGVTKIVNLPQELDDATFAARLKLAAALAGGPAAAAAVQLFPDLAKAADKAMGTGPDAAGGGGGTIPMDTGATGTAPTSTPGQAPPTTIVVSSAATGMNITPILIGFGVLAAAMIMMRRKRS